MGCGKSTAVALQVEPREAPATLLTAGECPGAKAAGESAFEEPPGQAAEAGPRSNQPQGEPRPTQPESRSTSVSANGQRDMVELLPVPLGPPVALGADL